MLLSMTGFGKSEYIFANHKTTIELRSVNSKQLDLTLKLAPPYRDLEPEIRARLTPLLERGKVDVSIYNCPISTSETSQEADTVFNQQAIQRYINSYLALPLAPKTNNGSVPAEIMSVFLRYPDVLIQNANEELLKEENQLIFEHLDLATNAFLQFRKQEGDALKQMFDNKLHAISNLLKDIEPYEKCRVDNIRQRILTNLNQLIETAASQGNHIAIDQNRLEQEMIYYLEKLDITEEKVRLDNHIRYFAETMNTTSTGVGKKLGFIAQEMGREINTLGSKSNQSEMQIIVVNMKDLLEQIKEQVLNVL